MQKQADQPDEKGNLKVIVLFIDTVLSNKNISINLQTVLDLSITRTCKLQNFLSCFLRHL